MCSISENDQLIVRECPADTETPVSLKLKLGARRDGSFLFESIVSGTQLSRYSFLGHDPIAKLEIRNGQTTVFDEKGEKIHGWEQKSPQTALRDFINLARANPPTDSSHTLPPMASGAFGYIGYDMIQHIEPVKFAAKDVLNVPEACLIVPRIVIIFDHLFQKLLIVARQTTEQSDATIQAKMDEVEACFAKPTPGPPQNQEDIATGKLTSNTTKARYLDIVETARDYIKAGDIFQVVPSQRWHMPFEQSPLSLYRALRQINPSAFMFMIALGNLSLVGSSPEIMVRVRNNRVAIRPIAGTRPRSGDETIDKARESDLLADPKELAEHLMLLDLGRNDVGRVAAWGSVEVTESFKVEQYSHVMHIISQVEGDLRPGLDIIDALFAGFPAGTVSGAPKIRAMQIIDELEPERRGIYGGAVGYFGWNGDVDTCIALRTALLKDQKIYIQAGGGVVLDSVAEAEFQETEFKANALKKAAELSKKFRITETGNGTP